MELVQRRLGIRPFPVDAVALCNQNLGDDIAEDAATTCDEMPLSDQLPLSEGLLSLLDHLLGLRPRLAIPLAQEIPGYRPHILRRILRQGAFFTALFGAEPVPLIDLPLQVAVSWKMALQIAAIYGRPGLDYRSREMMGTLAANLAARVVCQQALKLTPFIGWALSAAVSGSSAWLLGKSLIRYYEESRWINPEPRHLLTMPWATVQTLIDEIRAQFRSAADGVTHKRAYVARRNAPSSAVSSAEERDAELADLQSIPIIGEGEEEES